MKKSFLFFLPLVAILYSGCAVTKKTPIEPQLIYNNYKKVENKPQELQNLYVNYYVDEKRNQVLNLMKMGLYEYQKGYYQDAVFAFDKSLMHIESLYGETELSEKAKSLWYGEDQKFFVGEPYERAMVYYYRGLLYLKTGDYENARASFKGGLLQDARAENQEYQADFLSLILLEALSSKANGDDELYKDAITEFFTIYKPTVSNTYEPVTRAVIKQVSTKISRISSRVECLSNSGTIDWNEKIKQYSCQIEGRLFYFNAEKESGIEDNKQTSATTSRISSRSECLSNSGTIDWNDKIRQYSCQIEGKLLYFTSQQDSKTEEKAESNSQAHELIENTYLTSEFIDKSNVFIFIDTGLSPIKDTSGKSNSELTFRTRSYSMIAPKVTVNNTTQNSIILDDIYYQASTRGGREIDKIIDGKAAYKDETKETGKALVSAGTTGLYVSATAAMASDNEYVRGAAGVVALVSLTAMAVGSIAEATSDAMIASADARYWDNLPGGIFVYMNTLPIGKHIIEIQAETLKKIEINVVENSIVIKHAMPNIQKPMVLINEQDIIDVVREKDKYDTKYQKITKGEDNNETISNKFNNFISDFKL